MRLKIPLFIYLFLIVYFFLGASFCQAADNFLVSYDNNYQVLESGVTEVTQQISLRNLTSEYYATEYTLILIGQEINNISASDGLGPLKTEVKKDGNEVKIHVFFNEKVGGINKILKWVLKYNTISLAFKNGLSWEIILPGPPAQEKIENYNISLKVPSSFGPVLYTWPMPQENFYWTKDNLTNGGVTVTFGKYQIFNFKLLYHLKNSKLIPVTTEIALPPQTGYQQINYNVLNPKPDDVTIDKDGNWLAHYNLSPNEKIDILAEGFAKIFFQPQIKEKLTSEMRKQYLLPRPLWEVNHEEIIKIAKNLKSAREVYDYVVSNLDYNYQQTESKPVRLGALKALSHKDEAICIEFTDLFISLCRAAGIPARAINGYAYTTNPKLRPLASVLDILHAWPEYYDSAKENWVMVDPTWGKTTSGLDYFSKLDLNHFTFVKKGISSLYPHPAGSYKAGDEKQKDVFISFTDSDREIKKGNLEVFFHFPEKQYLFLPIKGKIVLINQGPGIVEIDEARLTTSPLVINKSLNLQTIPPFGKKEIPLNISPFNYYFKNLLSLKTTDFSLTLQLNDNEYNHKIAIIPMLIYLLIGGFCVLIFAGIILARKTWNIYFSKPRK